MSTQLVQLKRSAVASKVPVVGDLSLGELALNTYDGRVFFKKNPGTESIVEVATLENTQAFTGNKSFSANVGIGTTSPGTPLHIRTASPVIRLEDSDTGLTTIAAEMTANILGSLVLSADPGNAGAGSAIQFFVDNSEKARISANGNLLIGTTSGADRSLSVSKNITGATSAYGILNNGAIQSDVTSLAFMNRTLPTVADAVFTLSNLYHYSAGQSTIGASATLTNQVGFLSESTLVGGTANYGFWAAAVPAANVTTGKAVYGFVSSHPIATGGGNSFNIFSNGSAPNYFAGNLGIGVTSPTDRSLAVSKTITGATTAYGIMNNGTIQSDVTAATFMNRTNPSVVDAVFTLPNLYHYSAAQSTIGTSATLTNQTGFLVEASLIGATTNVGFSMNGVAAASVTTGKFVYAYNSTQAIASGGGTAFNLYMQGTAPNYLAGNLGIGNTAPSDALSVNGTAYFGANVTILSALTANGSVGTAGQVLTSNATGTYWSTVSGGGGATNLSLTSNSSTVSINSDTGTDVIVLAANSTTAGVLTADTQTIGGIKTFNSNTILTTVTAGTWNGTVIDPAYGGTGQTSLNASRTALTGYLAITSSGGTTTLTNTSAEFIYVSGTLGHTITLPDVTTLALGWSFNVFNSSSLTVTVQSSGLNAIGTVINSGHTVRYICVATTGTTAASWTASYEGATTRTGGGSSVFNFQPSIGNLTLTGTLTANGGVGTAGQVLTSNATGVYWSTVAGGGGSTATYNVTIGDGTATSFTITHSLAKANIFVSIRDVSTGYFVYPDIKYTSTNAVVLEFVDPPTTNQYYVAVIGA